MNNQSSSQLPCASSGAVELLNQECFCLSLDQTALACALDSELGTEELSAMVKQRCPYLFASQPVFVGAQHIRQMAEVVRAVESVVAMPQYRELVLAGSPTVAQLAPTGALGVFFGYDFHLIDGHLGLIEINTNAGGAMLNAVMARAHRACCADLGAMAPTPAEIESFEKAIVGMFRHEWALAGRTVPLKTIAIVDSSPWDQYLYPEFLLFQKLFERHGLHTIIADPSEFEWRDGALRHGIQVVDLVYNRLTDFYLELPESSALREAYLLEGIVLTPHPQAHALYANKRRLALLSDARQLEGLGVPPSVQKILLENIPRTEVVEAADAQRLWAARRSLFFKPVAGFGSRAAYRGDKLTKGVWQDILAGDYVAQEMVKPGARSTGRVDSPVSMKFDLRAYAYNASVQWLSARVYQGQTTNFRTSGGGFAPVYTTPDASVGE
ncbi:MAG: hypothetical protein HYX42_19610 [Polaromonas sp.]|uniref:hypothetical protein n=1 Tax=Polaromonas sp. TaxID=1869339 RepID=UPI0025DD4123|nr:hypothetical protein [Polaromonas sp.]MBI2728450.1 hypothetical protein [Polaromonas sp.]